jgi:hypothetical protein
MKYSEVVSLTFCSIIIILTSCNKLETEDNAKAYLVDYVNIFGNKIKFLNEDGSYQRLNSTNFSEYYMSWNTEENARTHKIEFENYRLEKDLFADSDDVFYALSAQSIDGTISLSYILMPNDSGDLIILRACKCETNSCATTWGCEADTGGGGCRCTHCSGDCKKTSEVKEDS